MPAPAGHDQIAHAGQAGERLLAGAGSRSEACHLPQAAADEAGLGVVAEAEAVDPAGGQGDDVLRRRAELDADEIVVHVHAERGRDHRVLQLDRELRVGARHDRRGRQPLRDLLCVVRAREDRNGPGVDQLRQAAAAVRVETLREDQHRAVAGQGRDDRGEGPARDGEHDEVGLIQRRSGDGLDAHPREIDLREVARVAPRGGYLLDLRRIAARERDVVPARAEQGREHGAPRPTADHDDVHGQLRRTKSITTGMPASAKRSRSRFSTQ